MKALFLKEFKQGRPLLLFAVALAVLIAIGRALIARSNPYYLRNVDELNRGAGALLLCLPVVLTLFAGSGLFSAEADRGTMPVLLALPLSRRRIWLTKGLAGLALASTASILLLGLGATLMPRAFASVSLWAYLPDICLWTALAFGAALFTSVLVGNTTASLGFALIVAGALAGVTACLVFLLGAPLLWYADTLDMALWGGVFAVSLLLASAVALARGELLDSGRKWRFAGRTLLLGMIASVFLVSIVARFATRYQRSAVVSVGALERDDAGPIAVLPVAAFGDPIRVWRKEGVGWTAFTEETPQGPAAGFRRNYAVAVDLRTGRELLQARMLWPRAWERGGFLMACSRDGRFAAVLRPRSGLTWGARWGGPQVLEIRDLKARRRWYAGTPAALAEEGASVSALEWSPRGKYLALTVRCGGAGDKVHLLRPDGSEAGVLPGEFVQSMWSPTEEVLFCLDRRGGLHRIAADDLSDTVLWTGMAKSARMWEPIRSISSDGRWVLLADMRFPEAAAGGKPPTVGETTLYVVRSDRGQAVRVWRRLWHSGESGGIQAAWSADGRTLYALSGEKLLSWRPGSAALAPTGITIPRDGMSVWKMLGRPGGGMVLWLRQPKATTWPDSQEIVDGKFLLLDPNGDARESPASSLAKDHWLLGFDAEGRAVLEGDNEIVTADLDTGEVRKVYP